MNDWFVVGVARRVEMSRVDMASLQGFENEVKIAAYGRLKRRKLDHDDIRRVGKRT